VLLLRHPLATLLDDRTHEYLFRAGSADMSGGPDRRRDDPDSLTASG